MISLQFKDYDGIERVVHDIRGAYASGPLGKNDNHLDITLERTGDDRIVVPGLSMRDYVDITLRAGKNGQQFVDVSVYQKLHDHPLMMGGQRPDIAAGAAPAPTPTPAG